MSARHLGAAAAIILSAASCTGAGNPPSPAPVPPPCAKAYTLNAALRAANQPQERACLSSWAQTHDVDAVQLMMEATKCAASQPCRTALTLLLDSRGRHELPDGPASRVLAEQVLARNDAALAGKVASSLPSDSAWWQSQRAALFTLAGDKAAAADAWTNAAVRDPSSLDAVEKATETGAAVDVCRRLFLQERDRSPAQILACEASAVGRASGLSDAEVLEVLGEDHQLAPDDLAGILKKRPNLTRTLSPLAACHGAGKATILASQAEPGRPARFRLGQAEIPPGVVAVASRLAERSKGDARLCYLHIAAAACLNAVGSTRECSEPRAIARYLQQLPISEARDLYLSTVFTMKHALYQEFYDTRSVGVTEALLQMHVALAQGLRGSESCEGLDQVLRPGYHVDRAQKLWHELHPQVPFPLLAELTPASPKRSCVKSR